MAFAPPPRARGLYCLLLTLVSGGLWISGWLVSQHVMGFAALASGISLIYLPAGVRLAILLMAGVWGAVGISLVFPLALTQVIGDASLSEVAVYSLVGGFAPYAAVVLVRRIAGVGKNLQSLRAGHLPLLAAAVSISSALAFNLAFAAFGRMPEGTFLSGFTAMAAGDFFGCLAVVVLVRAGIVLYRLVVE